MFMSSDRNLLTFSVLQESRFGLNTSQCMMHVTFTESSDLLAVVLPCSLAFFILDAGTHHDAATRQHYAEIPSDDRVEPYEQRRVNGTLNDDNMGFGETQFRFVTKQKSSARLFQRGLKMAFQWWLSSWRIRMPLTVDYLFEATRKFLHHLITSSVTSRSNSLFVS